MKRTLVGLAIAFVAFSSFAEVTHQYIVGVRAQRDPHALLQQATGIDAAARRNFRDFASIGQFTLEITDSEAAALRGRPDIRFVERPMTVYAFGSRPPSPEIFSAGSGSQTMPWGVANVHAPDVWPVTRGIGVNVAIVDTGIDPTNPDLGHQYAGGYNAIMNSSDTTDDNGHGTHVAGTIAAVDNLSGVVGVAPGARIWAIRALQNDPKSGTATGSTVDISAGIDWIVRQKGELGGNWIVNMSLGICADPTNVECATAPPHSLLDACQKASDAGILIFAASGNDSAAGSPKPVSYPAAFPTVVAVGAVDCTGKIADFSDQGPELAIVAPGVSIHSTYLVGKGTDAHVDSPDGNYDAIGMQYAATGSATGRLVVCGTGKQASDFPAEVKGNVALVQRGDVNFSQKVQYAMAAGAIATVVYNNAAGTFLGTLTDPTISWHLVVSMSREDGDVLATKAGSSVTVTNKSGDYQWMDGTSMASPHAAAVAALVWGAAPNATAADVRNAMLTSAHDLGTPGQDVAYGFGLIDAVAATKLIAPQFFTFPETPSGRRTIKRGH